MKFDLKASIAARERLNAEGTIKGQEDLNRYRAVIEKTKPNLIIECGTAVGGSALWFANNAKCQVITIDIDDCVTPSMVSAWKGRVIQVTASSTDLKTFNTVARIAYNVALSNGLSSWRDLSVLVSLDSDHSASHVFKEIEFYSQFVRPGNYMVVEDTLVRMMPYFFRSMFDGDPLDAVEFWMEHHSDEWEIDLEIEGMYPITNHLSGWLRRIEQ